MPALFAFPITRIGQPNWEARLQQHLAAYDVDCVGVEPVALAACEARLGVALPAPMRAYYLAFGATDTSDFMHGLLPLSELTLLPEAGFEFISLYFMPADTQAMVYFADSPGTDPLCFSQQSGEIYLFSHDPLRKGKVFTDFSQYLLAELLELEHLLGEGLDEPLRASLAAQYLAAEGVDDDFRNMKLF